jgi:hypothetical protein
MKFAVPDAAFAVLAHHCAQQGKTTASSDRITETTA